ncbi:MAG: DUF3422 domain-containing protein [Chthoniobacter sp.]|uniref:DUF3422 domain-containing protein n=1 Tax=Chthoniobacter sp. TaxID=2510640 RepID=UPI0032AD83F3
MTAVPLERFHSQYRELHAELLARPFPVVAGQVMVAHRAILFTAEEVGAHRAAIAALATYPGVVAGPDEQGFQLLRVGAVDLRIERHGEFTSFTVFAPQSGVPFAESAIDLLPAGWMEGIPGRVLAAVEIASEQVAAEEAGTGKTMERVLEYFAQDRLVGGWVVERVASVWSTFRLDERGATRFLVQVHRLTTGRYGRLLQRLVEIETYRLAAMLSLPLARDLLPEVEMLEAQHVALVERIGVMDAGEERALLGDLTNLSLAAERLQARCGSRFSRTESYARILSARVRELREEQVPGYQTISEFFDRRLAQALHTCSRADAGLRALSARVQSTTGLLRTRVEVNLQSQNQQLLASVDRRAAAQLRLQHNVEGLSVVVLTYYLANLLKLALEGTEAAGYEVKPLLIVALVLPLLAGGVWWAVRRARHQSH